jgi:hypothetical protein
VALLEEVERQQQEERTRERASPARGPLLAAAAALERRRMARWAPARACGRARWPAIGCELDRRGGWWWWWRWRGGGGGGRGGERRGVAWRSEAGGGGGAEVRVARALSLRLVEPLTATGAEPCRRRCPRGPPGASTPRCPGSRPPARFPRASSRETEEVCPGPTLSLSPPRARAEGCLGGVGRLHGCCLGGGRRERRTNAFACARAF